MHSSAIRKLFNSGQAGDVAPSPGVGHAGTRRDPSDRTDPQASSQCLLSLAKAESLRSMQRRQLASPALSAFPVWDVAVFLFENYYENRRVTPADIGQEIAWSENVTIRHLRLLEADGVLRVRSIVGEPDMSVTLSAKAHAAIGDYLTNAA